MASAIYNYLFPCMDLCVFVCVCIQEIVWKKNEECEENEVLGILRGFNNQLIKNQVVVFAHYFIIFILLISLISEIFYVAET